MKKKTVTLIMVLVMLLTCVGCGDSGEGESGASLEMAATLEEMKKTDTQMPKTLTVTNTDENAEATFAVLTDFDYAKVDSFTYCYSDEGTPEEIAIVLVKEKSSVGDLMKALQAHIDSRKATFEAYDPAQAAVVENAVLTFQDRYVLMAIGSTAGAMQDIFKNAVK